MCTTRLVMTCTLQDNEVENAADTDSEKPADEAAVESQHEG